jgi:glycosyltransferase involved in cell wall biosynthesis
VLTDQPLISVILTSYNHERYLREAIESALAQTYPSRELVIIDDASTDSSPQIATEYRANARLLLLEQNVGTYPALNRAIGEARGEWVAILNSDDVWEPEKLAAQLDEVGEAQFSFTNGHFIDENGQPCEYHTFGRSFFTVPSGRMVERLIFHNRCYPSTVMFTKDLWERAGRFREDLICLGDWDLFLRMSELTNFSYVNRDLARYRVHGTQTSRRIAQMRAEEIDIRERRIHAREAELLAGAPDRAAMKRALAHSAAALGTQYHLAGRAGDARRMYLRSLALNPLRGKSFLRLLLAMALPRIKSP